MSSVKFPISAAVVQAELPKVRSGVGAPVSFKPQTLPSESSDNANPRRVTGQYYLAPTSDVFVGDDAHAEVDVAIRALGGEYGGPRVPKFDAITAMAVSAALGETPDARIAALTAGIKAKFPEAVVRKLDRPANAAIGEHHEPGFVEVVAGGRLLKLVVTQVGFEELTEATPALPKKPQ